MHLIYTVQVISNYRFSTLAGFMNMRHVFMQTLTITRLSRIYT